MKSHKKNLIHVARNFLSFIFLLISLKSNSQSPTLKFIHYTTTDGLPSSQIYQVFQDSRGYLWFTTDHGLVKYNGYEFKVFSTEDGLTDNTVFKIFEDHNKKLWLLTFAGGICIYHNNKIKPYKFNDIVKQRIMGNIPLGLYIDTAENVFVTCHQVGEFKIDKNGKASVEFKFKSNKDYHQVFVNEHARKNLLLSIFSYNDHEQPMILYYRNANKYDSVAIPPVKQRRACAIRLHDNRILFGVSNHLFEIKNHNIELLTTLPADIICTLEDHRKRLWVGTSSGVFVFNDTYSFTNNSFYLSRNFISDIKEDREGGFWITTINNGLYYFPTDRIKNYVFDNEILHEPFVITSDNKTSVYAGYWSGAVATMDNQNLTKVNTSTERNQITCLYNDPLTGRLYIGSRVSGYLLKDSFHLLGINNIPSIPLDFKKSKNGSIYAGADRVIYKIRNDSIITLGNFRIRVNCIYEIDTGTFLLGSNSGVYLFNEEFNKPRLYCNELKDVRVDDIRLFEGYLCFATRGKGLLLKRENTFKWIKQTDGLASNLVHKIIVHDNTIWCATNNGITQIAFSDINNFKYSITNISIKDGLPSNEVHDLTILHDTLFAATGDGISFFNINHQFFSNIEAPLYFTSLKVNNSDTVISGYYKLAHSMNNIRIGFEALSFRNTGDISYHYILTNNQDSIINTTKNRTAEFLSLNPGNYTFSVTALNSSGALSEKPVSFKFTIRKPFWQEWWFRIAVVLCITLFVYIVLKRHINRIRKQEEIKTAFNKQLVQFEMKALRAQMNPHFIFNVINSIQDYILKNDARSAQKYLTKFARLVRLILDNSVKSEVVLQEELKAAELYIELEQQRFENKFEFILNVDEEVDTEQIILPAMIIQPYLENAIKHGISHLSTQGKLILRVIRENNYIIISIEDNGVGRAASAEKNKTNVRDHVSYGIIITAKRMDAYNVAYNSDISSTVTDLTDEKGTPAGTRIEVRIPVKYKQLVAD